MTKPNVPNDQRSPGRASANAGPQSGPGGVGGEPKGTRVDARSQDRGAQAEPAGHKPRPEHSPDKAQPGYRARPAGQSGLGEQDDHASTIREPQGDGNYIATDRGDKPLRNG
ncbi:hypothetical protein ACFWZ4_11320 [Frateuria sp. GZRe12]|uniref:hypothetical protein n=1 Tax=Frateuria sp. GZRe12 TaxID=3351533 RepID=UPI003EDC093E